MKQERADGSVPGWAEIASKLPDSLTPRELKLVHGFYTAQVRMAKGQEKKARKVFDGLDSQPDYRSFEDSHEDLLEGVKKKVRG
jgi:hypothetical protein